jgi:N-terminal domain of toast_rack, DUF2154
MNGNNMDPEGRSGTDTLNLPEQTAAHQGTIVTSESLVAHVSSQPITERPSYPQAPVPMTTHPVYMPAPEPTPQQPAIKENRGANPVLVILLAILGGVVLLGVVFFIAGLVLFSNIVNQVTNPAVGELRTETQSVPLGGAKSAVADVSMGVGELSISGGATDLMNATFTYNIDSWKPIVSYNVNANNGVGTLLVQQPKSNNISTASGTRYEWDLRFNNDVPMTMKVDLGVGQGDLKLSGLNLTRLEVNNGVGDSTIDLSGPWEQNLDVVVNGGVGKVTVILPTDTGVRVTAEGGLGHVSANGLTANGSTYTNDSYGKTPYSINIDIKTGIGDIQLVQGQ